MFGRLPGITDDSTVTLPPKTVIFPINPFDLKYHSLKFFCFLFSEKHVCHYFPVKE